MASRRQFLQRGVAAALTIAAPSSVFATDQQLLDTRRIPGTDESLPVIGLGNSVAFRNNDRAVATQLIDLFLDHGGRYIDVSGASRFTVGRLAVEEGKQDKLFLGNYLEPQKPAMMRADLRRVAEAQGKVALDLVHTRDLEGYRRQHATYLALKEEGLARYIGIARSGQQWHTTIGQLIDDGLVDFIQTNYSLLEPDAADRLLPLAREKGVAVCINRPFINGAYFSVVRGHKLPDWVAEFDCHSWAQFSLKFILANPAVTCVLTETANARHARDNLGAGAGRVPDVNTQQRMLQHIRKILG